MKYSVVFYLDFLIEQTYDQQKNGAPREHFPNAECKPCTKSSQSIAFPRGGGGRGGVGVYFNWCIIMVVVVISKFFFFTKNECQRPSNLKKIQLGKI